MTDRPLTGLCIGITALFLWCGSAEAQRQGKWLTLSKGFPVVRLDTASIARVDSITYRAHFRIRFAKAIPVPANPQLPLHIESGMEAQLRCRDRSFRPMRMLFVDTAGHAIAKTDVPGPWIFVKDQTEPWPATIVDWACAHQGR